MAIIKGQSVYGVWDYSEGAWKLYATLEDAVHAHGAAVHGREVEVYVLSPALVGNYTSRRVVDLVLAPPAPPTGGGGGGGGPGGGPGGPPSGGGEP